jgi:hypothetical protein
MSHVFGDKKRMSKFKLLKFAAGVAIGFAAYKIAKNWFKFSIRIETEVSPEKRGLELNLFDCPACGLPAEINTIVTQLGEDGFFVTNYIISCCGDHDRVAVTEHWLTQNTNRRDSI